MPVKVLCIEDEHFIGELYLRALQKVGYEIKVIFDGTEGLREAQTDNYDIILLDIMLPGINGIDILHKLRQAGDKPNIKAKIIITTNLDQEENTRARIEQLADGYVIKAEITPRELVEFIQTIKPSTA